MTEQDRARYSLIEATVRTTLESLGLVDVRVACLPLEAFRGYVEVRAVAEVAA